MSESGGSVVLAHGAWADGSSWSKVIGALRAEGVSAVAAPLLLTSLLDDVAALNRTLERVKGPVVVVGTPTQERSSGRRPTRRSGRSSRLPRSPPTRARRWVMSSTAASRTRRAPVLAPDHHDLIWLPEEAFAAASPSVPRYKSRPCWPLCKGRSHLAASAFRSSDGTFLEPPVSPLDTAEGRHAERRA